MRKSTNKSNLPLMDQVRIVPLGNDTFEVYFDFSPIPVKMNKGYLDTVIKDIYPDSYNQMSVG